MTSSIYAIHDDLHNDGVIESITVDTPGSDYTTAPVTIGGDGTGATAEAVIRGALQDIIVTQRGNANYEIDNTTVTVNRNGAPAGVDATTTVTVFGFIDSVSNFIISDGGTNFSNGTTIAIDAPDLAEGRQATAKVFVENGVITRIEPRQIGGGYSFNPSFTLQNTGSGSGEVITIENIEGEIDTISVDNAGSNTNYESDKTTITIVGSGSGGAAEAGDILGVIQVINVTNGGQNYTTAPVSIGGDGTSATATAVIASISADENILQNDIEITEDMVSPGGGGVLRLYFSFVFASSPAIITVFNNSSSKGRLNADNSSQVVSNGYYRFDIDVEAADNINLQSSEDITSVNFIRSHLVQFGA